MEDDFLTSCVVDTIQRKVHLYSDEGEARTVECETVEEFMNVLHLYVRTVQRICSHIPILSLINKS